MNSANNELTSSIVRVRPFTSNEQLHLQQAPSEPLFLGDGSFATSDGSGSYNRLSAKNSIRKIINVVDDRMLIFDPPENNPIVKMQQALLGSSSGGGGGGSSSSNGMRQQNTSRIREHRFVFDRLFDEDASQNDVYCHTTRPLLDNVLDGYNATVFAYGATGCGKTHTISGTPNQPGIIFLTMKELFERIDSLRDTKVVDLSLSYLEIYNETIRDLLDPTLPPAGTVTPVGSVPRKILQLREDADKKISVSNLSSHKPDNVDQVMDMILQGNQNRTMSPTEANAVSSRSHAVLQINVTQKSRTADLSEAHTFATLSIIDLAGSERASATKNRGERLIEGANINKSLLALGNCINALCDPRQRGHVPYRDSKLTRLLKFSLGGNCKTVMIVCVSPSSQHYDETLNTLKYADRAKKIKTKVTRNLHNLDRHVGSYLKMITEQKAEIEQLRARESKVIEEALIKENRKREACIRALHEAMSSLDVTIERTSDDRLNGVKCLNRLQTINHQIVQMDYILKAIRQNISFVGRDDVPGVSDMLVIKPIEAALEQTKNKLLTEKDMVQQYCQSINSYHTIDSAASVLDRRLKETAGWTDDDDQAFDNYVQWKKTYIENQILQSTVNLSPADNQESSLLAAAIADVLFKFLFRLDELRSSTAMDPELLPGELALLIQEILRDITNMEPLLLGANIPCSSSNDDAAGSIGNLDLSFLRKPPSINSIGPFSGASSGPGNVSSHQGVSSSDSLPMASSTTSPKRYSAAVRRMSILKKKSPRLLKRSSVLIRSPSKSRKPSKRVRWEDDETSEDKSNANISHLDIEENDNQVLFNRTVGGGLVDGTRNVGTTSRIMSPLREVNLSTDLNNNSLDDTRSISTMNSIKQFGVRGDLTRRSLGKSRLSVLGVNKKATGRVEKENSSSPISTVEQSLILGSVDDNLSSSSLSSTSSISSSSGSSLSKYSGASYHLAPTTSSSMKQNAKKI